jgi:hypothetical protein
MNDRSPLLPEAVAHGAWLWNCFQIHKRTGQTSFEMVHHRTFDLPIYQFSEVVLARKRDATSQAKLDDRWVAGLSLGLRANSG